MNHEGSIGLKASGTLALLCIRTLLSFSQLSLYDQVVSMSLFLFENLKILDGRPDVTFLCFLLKYCFDL